MSNPQGQIVDVVDDITSTTLRHYTKKTVDNVGNNNALFHYIKKHDNLSEYLEGGTSLVEHLDYAENGTYQRYDGYEELNISPSQHLTLANFDHKQIAMAMTISGKERHQNRGKEAMIRLVKSRVKNLMTSFENNFEADLHSDGMSYGGKQVNGLKALISKSPDTGTIGGINRAQHAFWRNKSLDANAFLGAAPTSDTLPRAMNRMFNMLTRGGDKPDMILADDNYFEMYENSLQGIQRIQGSDAGNLGFSSVKYKGRDVILGGGHGGVMEANTMYFLNTKYIKVYHMTKEFLDELHANNSINQDARVKLYGFMGNMCISNCFTQGVLHH